jgi:hypothetical protein
MKYCENCFVTLHKPKKLQSHKKEPVGNFFSTPKCSFHPKKSADIFCVTDQVCICSSCVISKHKDHPCVDIQDGVKLIQSEFVCMKLPRVLEDIEESIENIDKEIQKLEVSKVKLKISYVEIGENMKEFISEKRFPQLLILKEKLISNSNAQFHLAKCYKNGNGIGKDLKKAVELYTLSGNQGNSKALNNLALMYEEGTGVDKDLKKAIELYTQATKLGNTNAKQNLRNLGDE